MREAQIAAMAQRRPLANDGNYGADSALVSSVFWQKSAMMKRYA
jgi:hypothetical protein